MIYNIYRYARNLIPGRKRGKNHIAFIYALMDALAYLKTVVYDIYVTGSSDPVYTAGTYTQGTRKIYRLGVYEVIVESTSAAPNNTSAWRKLQDYRVGAFARRNYSGNKLSLEFALNSIFGTAWGGLPYYGYIYITTNADTVGSFIIGEEEDESSTVEEFDSSEAIYEDAYEADRINFIIHFPVIEYTALGPNPESRETTVRNVVDKFIYAGIKYSITTYVGYPF